jgi:hypothetical protein
MHSRGWSVFNLSSFPCFSYQESSITPPLCISFRSVLQEVLDEKDKFRSLKEDMLPYLVRSQMVSQINSFYNLFFLACMLI